MTVHIRNPQGEDSKAWKLYCDEGVFRYVQFDGFIERERYGDPKDYAERYMGGKDIKEIQARVDKILKDYPDTVYGKVLQTIRGHFEKTAVKKHDPEEPLKKATQQLESEWYDVKGFHKEHPKESDKYTTEVALLFDQLDRTISDETFFQKTAELLNTYVRKYSKPLSPEEWKRRQAQYAAEEKAAADQKRKEQDEFNRKYAVLLEAEQRAFGVCRNDEDFHRLYREELEKIIAQTQDDDVKNKAREYLAASESRMKQLKEDMARGLLDKNGGRKRIRNLPKQ